MGAYTQFTRLLCCLMSLLVPRKPSQDDIKKGRMGQPRRRTYSQEVDTDRLVVEAVQAARTGNLQKMKTLRGYGIDFSIADYDSRSVLHQAVENNQLEVVRYLISNCKMPHNVPDRWGTDPMSEAKKKGHQDIVKFLQSCDDQKPSEMSDDDVSPGEQEAMGYHWGYKLCDAAARGDLPLLNQFYERGIDLSQHDYDGRTALHLACDDGKKEVAEFLLKLLPKDCIHTVDRFGHTPLSDAQKSNKAEIVDLLRACRTVPQQEAVVSEASEARDKLTARGDLMTAIHQADHLQVGQVLRQAEDKGFAAEILVSTEEQCGQWEKASGREQEETEEDLQMDSPNCTEVAIHCSKPIEEVCHSEKNTLAIMEAVLQIQHSFDNPLASDVMEVLIRRRDQNNVLELFLKRSKADPNVTGEGGRRPLYTALEVGNKQAVQLLLEHGADVNEASKQYTYSPLISLIRNYKLDLNIVLGLLEVLLSGGADQNAHDVDHGLSPIHHVIQSSRSGDAIISMIRVLLRWNADVDSVDRAGLTALQYAAGDAAHRPKQPLVEEERLKVVQFLANNKACINHRKNNGNTALHLAAKSNHCAIIHFLLLRGADSTTKNKSNYTAADLSPEDSNIQRVLVSYMASHQSSLFSHPQTNKVSPKSPKSRCCRQRPKKKLPTENTEDCSLEYCKNGLSNCLKPQSNRNKQQNSVPTTQRPSTAQTKAAQSALLKQAIEFLSERLGKKYIALIRVLNQDLEDTRTNALLDDIKMSFHMEGLPEIAYQGLRRWWERLGNAATLNKLKTALQDIRLFRLKREFEEKFALG